MKVTDEGKSHGEVKVRGKTWDTTIEGSARWMTTIRHVSSNGAVVNQTFSADNLDKYIATLQEFRERYID